MRPMIKYFLPFLLMTTFTGTLLAQEKLGPEKELTAEDLEESIKTLDEPMYTPFVELYLLEESKALRKEMQNTRAELIEKVVDKELSVADKTMSYATDTVTYFFYLIAGATSILVVIGWNSIRDMRNQLTSLAEKRVNELVIEYEQRLSSSRTSSSRNPTSFTRTRPRSSAPTKCIPCG
jgi:hypothetical protein